MAREKHENPSSVHLAITVGEFTPEVSYEKPHKQLVYYLLPVVFVDQKRFLGSFAQQFLP
ncbi:MAG: hypothetical protein COV51_02150 [Gallionellaceae bacterium CG11_big_fil_rev_8_21_14_0_20_60_62]|nr:MAG: hypothetical protein COV51_02150 [Gallionellaceae bacterium CG11_big_fil_rev_8_21_14_0_20_60_62]PIY06193.1 MAG: hypothetical protein COZ19_01675 [Gallionellaceae bacterium CG_4_10_14_3_um_filter_60_1069]